MIVNAILILLEIVIFINAEYKYKTNMEYINSEELVNKTYNRNKKDFESKLAEDKNAADARDNGGNYGDLIYKFRQNGDTLLVREVVIGEILYSNNKDIRWTVSINGARISSVRVLNFGRERANCLRIDVAGNDAEVVLRIPPLQDPRVLIEIYGF